RVEGASLQWNGGDDYHNAEQWSVASPDDVGVVTSLPFFATGATLGSPGVTPQGTADLGVWITEVMYNPADSEPAWEWVEVLNNSGEDIDFAATPFVFDDNSSAALAGPNISSGGIEQGKAAVLYNSVLTPAQVRAAWDPTGTRDVNFVPVDDFSPLNNTGDSIGLWASYDAYIGETVTGVNRTMENATATLKYASGASLTSGTWPQSNNAASIELIALGDDPQRGESWKLNEVGDGDAFYVSSTVAIYAGGDVGSPGQLPFIVTSPPGDFDDDGDVDSDDLAEFARRFGGVRGGSLGDWESTFGDGGADGASFLAAQRGFGSASGGESLSGADFLTWQRLVEFSPSLTLGAAVPEPAAALLGLLAWTVSVGARRASRNLVRVSKRESA
ncbi:MAG: hypothetical protein KDA61_23090, partial [Planctomycetales bacterium]|nr:hypothetical protein [Planctomycetales bacterium]